MRDRNAANLGQLRSWRVYPERDVSIAKQVGALVRSATAKHKQSGGVAAAWEATAPAGLQKSCQIVGVSGGVMSVKAASAAARFQLDRWLRSGGEAALRSGGVKRVKIL